MSFGKRTVKREVMFILVADSRESRAHPLCSGTKQSLSKPKLDELVKRHAAHDRGGKSDSEHGIPDFTPKPVDCSALLSSATQSICISQRIDYAVVPMVRAQFVFWEGCQIPTLYFA